MVILFLVFCFFGAIFAESTFKAQGIQEFPSSMSPAVKLDSADAGSACPKRKA